MTYFDELDESENSNEKLNVCGSVKSIQERFDDLEYAYESSIRFSEIALKNIADKITFGRAYIESIEKYLMAYQEYEFVQIHIKSLRIGSQEQKESLVKVLDFPLKVPYVKELIEKNTILIKSNMELKNRIVILLENAYYEREKFPMNLIEFLNN